MKSLNRIQTEKSGAAFTLIELLVVIAIISLLVSILLPSLNKARQLAKNVVCASNFRNLGLAVFSYNQDNDGLMPICAAWPNDTIPSQGGKEWTSEWSIAYALAPYMGMSTGTVPANSSNPFLCPSLNDWADIYKEVGLSVNYNRTYSCEQYTNGAWRHYASPLCADATVLRGKNISQAISPSEAIVLCDRANMHCDYDGTAPLGYPIVGVWLDGHAGGFVTGRPNGMLPFYLDCDAEWYGWFKTEPWYISLLYPREP